MSMGTTPLQYLLNARVAATRAQLLGSTSSHPESGGDGTGTDAQRLIQRWTAS